MAGWAFDSDLVVSTGRVPLGVTRPPERVGFFAMVILLSRIEPDLDRAVRTNEPAGAGGAPSRGEPQDSGRVADAGSIAHGPRVPTIGPTAADISLSRA